VPTRIAAHNFVYAYIVSAAAGQLSSIDRDGGLLAFSLSSSDSDGGL